jgi:hypothetical protein
MKFDTREKWPKCPKSFKNGEIEQTVSGCLPSAATSSYDGATLAGEDKASEAWGLLDAASTSRD